jgi:hypothetical protein
MPSSTLESVTKLYEAMNDKLLNIRNGPTKKNNTVPMQRQPQIHFSNGLIFDPNFLLYVFYPLTLALYISEWNYASWSHSKRSRAVFVKAQSNIVFSSSANGKL